MVSAEVPVFVMVTVCGSLTEPTGWLAKVRPVGATVTAVDPALPVPVRLITWGAEGTVTLSVIVNWAVSAVKVEGVKATLIEHVPPLAGRVPMQLSVSAKSVLLAGTVPVIVILLIVSGAVPALMTVSVFRGLRTLSVWFPKASFAGTTASPGKLAGSILATKAVPATPERVP
jgi:hypothetical protein